MHVLRKTGVWIITFLAGVGTGLWLARKEISLKFDPSILRLIKAMEVIATHYPDFINKDSLITKAINRVLNELDPYSHFMPIQEHDYVEGFIRGSFSGIGIEFGMVNDTPLVTHVLYGSPAFRKRLWVGDRILSANGVPLCGKNVSINEVVRRLRGPDGTTVNVRVYRPILDTLFEVEISRDDIPLPSIHHHSIIDSILFVKIGNFSAELPEEFLELLGAVSLHEIKGIVVDLRGNAGGVLESAIKLTEFFLDKGDTIVIIEDNSGERAVRVCPERGALWGTPLVVLTDRRTASASEVFAAAIQENDRGILAGAPTFGKSYFQEEFEVEGLGVMRLSVGKYLTPSGRSLSHSPYDSVRTNHRVYFTKKMRRILPGAGPLFPDIKVEDTGATPAIIQSLAHVKSYILTTMLLKEMSEMIYELAPPQLAFFLDTMDIWRYLPEVSIPSKEKDMVEHILKAQVGYHLGGSQVFYYFSYRVDPVVKKVVNLLKKREINSLDAKLRKILFHQDSLL